MSNKTHGPLPESVVWDLAVTAPIRQLPHALTDHETCSHIPRTVVWHRLTIRSSKDDVLRALPSSSILIVIRTGLNGFSFFQDLLARNSASVDRVINSLRSRITISRVDTPT